MANHQPRRFRSDAEQFKHWLIENVERVDALTRAATIRICDVDRDKLTSSLSTLDVLQLRYLRVKLDETLARLQDWNDKIGDAVCHRDTGDENESTRNATGIVAREKSPMKIEWLDPWYEVEAVEREFLEAELRREVAPGHDLGGVPAIAIGRRKDRNDVLFETAGRHKSVRRGAPHLGGSHSRKIPVAVRENLRRSRRMVAKRPGAGPRRLVVRTAARRSV